MTNAIRWTPEMLADYQKRKQSKSKYGGRKTELDGVKFDSRKEANRWLQLEQLAKAGQISELRRQIGFELAPPVKLEGEKRAKPALRYFADAVYLEAGKLVIEDTKSPATRKTPAYRIKKHLMASVLGLQIREV